MVSRQDYLALMQGMHRKLLNINCDIRAARKRNASREEIFSLMLRKKTVDKTYSKCVKNLDNLEEQDKTYREAIHIYNTH